MAASLPDFPWDTLLAAKKRAGEHPQGICDLSIGTPVDPTPELAMRALSEAADAPGYPPTIGIPELREAMVRHVTERWHVRGLDENGVLPVIGTKELVTNLPWQLGLGADSTLVIPEIAYPSYAVGGAIAGAKVVACDDPAQVTEADAIWINTPGNPHGAVMSADELRAWVNRARELGAVLVSDECYGEFGWEADPVSVLHPDICGGSHEGIITALSMSKRSNLAGYRAGFVAGCPKVVAELREMRKHGGFLMPRPVQVAFAEVLGDQAHVEVQRQRYLARRGVLKPALEAAGFRIDHSEAGLYLWATRDEQCRTTIDWLAERGILAAPGDFYGAKAENHVRLALTGSDERIESAASRLRG
ncbi:succinyldiaminopimelate transaminase [Mariniluteicoccus endophyticus]